MDFVKMRGASGDPAADLALAQTVFAQCSVKVLQGKVETVDNATSDTWLGGDTDLKVGTCGAATQEELDAFNGATAKYKLKSRIRAFYVETISSGARGDSYPPYCATGTAAPLAGMLSRTNSGGSRTLAHEMGHILLDSAVHPADKDNLMHPTNTSTGEKLTAAQCQTINANL